MRWKNRPEGSNWGEFGQDDQLGRANLLTPEQVKKGAREIVEGLSFALSLPLEYPGGNLLNARRYPPQLRPTFRNGDAYFNFPLARNDANATDVICDDQVLMSLQYSTQWDALAHVGSLFDADGDGTAERVYYNGYRANEHITGPLDYPDDAGSAASPCGTEHSYAGALGIENLAAKGMQGRGVLVDLYAHFGDEHRAVGYDDLMGVMRDDKVEVEPGDMLVLRTGFADMVLGMGGAPDAERLHHSCSALDGRDERLLQWISDSKIATISADNYAVERYPARSVPGKHPLLPLHHLCLFKLGIALGELWYLKDLGDWLRAHGRSRFLLTAPPLRLSGAVGSPVTPIATV
jgi:kynurenine formamidase